MSGKVLYRKYRPTKLTDVVGQEQVTAALQNALKHHKLGHAYLFIGPRGTGKTSVARIFAHAVNNFDYQVEDNYLDIIEIDAASNTGVDNIRELREKAVIAPTSGQYKVYIIDEVHMLTKSASNALLKTLEEPPEHVIFIMATTDAHKVPITISSRTQVFTFKLADADTMLQYLQKVAKKEKIKITDDALQLVVRRGGGSFRDSMSLLDQVTNLIDGEITAELLSHALGLPQDQVLTDLLNSYTRGDKAEIQRLLKDLLNTGIKPEIIASELINRIIGQPKSAWLPLLAQLPAVQPPFPEAKLLLALLSNIPTTTSPFPTATASSAPNTAPSTASPISATAPAPVASSPITPPAQPVAPRTSASPTNPAIVEPINSAPTVQMPEPNKPEQPSTDTPSSTPHLASEPTETEQTRTEAPQAPTDPAAFNWDSFLAAVHADSDGLYQQLQKVDYELSGDTLHLYPSTKFTQGILQKPAHSQIMLKSLNGLALEVHNFSDKPAPKDATLSQISAIMGDVREIKGDLPF